MKQFLIFCSLVLAAISLPISANSLSGHYDQKDLSMDQQIISLYTRALIPIQSPILADSVDINHTTYQRATLLDTYVTQWMTKGSYTVLRVDSTGLIQVEKPQSGQALKLIHMEAMASEYAVAKLRMTCGMPWVIYMDGKEIRRNKTCTKYPEEVAVPITLLPNRRVKIDFKILVAAQQKSDYLLKLRMGAEQNNKAVPIEINGHLPEYYSLWHTVYGERVSNVEVSSNGQYVLTSYVNKINVDCTTYKQVLRETKRNAIVRTFPKNKDLKWMPKSSLLYYMEKGENGLDVHIVYPKTLIDERVIQGLPEGNWSWSTDEQFLFSTKMNKMKEKKVPYKRLHNRYDRLPDSRQYNQIIRYNRYTGLTETLTFGNEHSMSFLGTNEKDTKMLMMMDHKTPTQRPFYAQALLEVDMNTLAVDTLAKDAFITNAAYITGTNKIVVMGSPEAFNKIGKNCGKEPVANDFDNQAFLLDLDTKEVTSISKDFAPSLHLATTWTDNGCIYFKAEDKDREKIAEYDLIKNTWTILPMSEDVVRTFSVARQKGIAAYSGVSMSSSSKAYMYSLKKHQETLYTSPMSKSLKDVHFGRVEDCNFTTQDGTTIYGTLTYPPTFDKQKKYPMIVYYYGGTSPTPRYMDFYYSSQLFASRGYMVYVLNPSGATGFGQEFSARHVNAWGKRTADEIIEGTKKVLKDHSFIDAKHVGCIGASYGGFMTMYLQTQTDIFAAAVAHAGISMVASYWGEGYWGVGYNSVAAANSYPWTNKELFTQGALFQADKIHTPLLMMHGSVDTNVPIGESIQLYNALRVLGRDVELITIDGENHHVMDWKKRQLWHNCIMAWFSKWLQEKPAWWDAIKN